LTRKKIPAADLVEAGLIIPNNDRPGFHDRFRNRVIFPIREHREGRIVAFGGRALGDDPAKYLNTPETPIYTKGRVLYGLREALSSIRNGRRVIVVEGYFDRLALAKAGFGNSVAPCGTALTGDQVRLLKQFSDTIYVVFDADAAGISAAKRALELCLTMGAETLAVPLPEGKDPDDLIRDSGAESFQELLRQSMPGIDFLIYSAKSRHDVSISRGRKDLVEEMIPFLGAIENSIDRGSYISRIADLVGVPDTSIVEVLRRAGMQKRATAPAAVAEEKPVVERKPEIDQRERDLFVFLLSVPERISATAEALAATDLITADGKMIYKEIIGLGPTDKNAAVSKLIDRMPSDGFKKLIADLLIDPQAGDRLIKQNDDIVLKTLAFDFKRIRLKVELEANQRKVRDAGKSGENVAELLARQMELMKQFRDLQGKAS
jgi:DNA primase